MKKQNKIGILLMTYGSPRTLDDIPAYLKNIYGGREPSEEAIAEFRRRYDLIGGSPLIRITQDQAKALESVLNAGGDGEYIVEAGMRFSEPFIPDVVQSRFNDCDTVVGIIMSPQYSPIIMKGYIAMLTEIVEKLPNKPKLAISGDWHLQPHFIAAIAKRVTEALETLPDDERSRIPILLTAHSMPKRVIENEPDYINHLKETAAAVAEKVGLSADRWQFCYQSAGHTPEEWLKPDFADLMPVLKEQGATHVLIAPIQFLADHLEILYDIDIGAREQAESQGLAFLRTQSLNTEPEFIEALSDVVKDLH